MGSTLSQVAVVPCKILYNSIIREYDQALHHQPSISRCFNKGDAIRKYINFFSGRQCGSVQLLIFVFMANRLKSSKSQSPDPHRLKPEKVEQVTVKQLVKDE